LFDLSNRQYEVALNGKLKKGSLLFALCFHQIISSRKATQHTDESFHYLIYTRIIFCTKKILVSLNDVG